MKSNAKTTIMALAVLAMAFCAIVALPAADADPAAPEPVDAKVVLGDDTVTVAFDEVLPATVVEKIVGDLSEASVMFKFNPDVTLGFANMAQYELIKGNLIVTADGTFIVYGYDEIAELGAAWTAQYVPAIEAFATFHIDGEEEEDEGEDVMYVTTTVIIDTPKAVAEAAAEAQADADQVIIDGLNETIAADEATIAANTATIAELTAKVAELQAIIDADDSAAKIAELTAQVAELQATIKAKDKTIADKDASIAELTKTTEDLQKKIDELSVKPVEKPFLDTGAGKCAVIIIVFLFILVIWFAYQKGVFSKIGLGGKKE